MLERGRSARSRWHQTGGDTRVNCYFKYVPPRAPSAERPRPGDTCRATIARSSQLTVPRYNPTRTVKEVLLRPEHALVPDNRQVRKKMTTREKKSNLEQCDHENKWRRRTGAHRGRGEELLLTAERQQKASGSHAPRNRFRHNQHERLYHQGERSESIQTASNSSHFCCKEKTSYFNTRNSADITWPNMESQHPRHWDQLTWGTPGVTRRGQRPLQHFLPEVRNWNSNTRHT